MLAEADIAGNKRRLACWKLRRSQVLPAEQPIHGTCADAGEERAFGVDPRVVDVGCLLFDRPAAQNHPRVAGLEHLDCAVRILIRSLAGAEENRPWRAQRDELV